MRLKNSNSQMPSEIDFIRVFRILKGSAGCEYWGKYTYGLRSSSIVYICRSYNNLRGYRVCPHPENLDFKK